MFRAQLTARLSFTRPVSGVDHKAFVLPLAAGPWLWPKPGDPECAAIASLFGIAEPSEASLAVPVLSMGPGDRADLWLFPAPPSSGLAEAPLSGSAHQALSNAISAVERSLPALAVRKLRQLERRATAAHLCGTGAVPASLLSGPSFGLGFALAAAAIALDKALPETTIAIGEVAANGDVFEADCEAKLRLLAACSVRITKVLVAPSMVATAAQTLKEAGRTDVTVKGMRRVSNALEDVFGKDVATLPVTRAGSDPVARGRVLRQLRWVVRQGHAATTQWRPVRQCAEAAQREWAAVLTEVEKDDLKYLIATAARHAGESEPKPMPPLAWWQALPAQVKTSIAAGYVQQAGDYGVALAPEIEAHAVAAIGSIDSQQAIEAAGSLGRYWQLTVGKESLALASLTRVVLFAWDNQQYGEFSRPLCAALRLAGALKDSKGFDDFAKLAQEFVDEDLAGDYDKAFVALAVGTGAALLGRHPMAELHLRQVADAWADYRGFSAWRWLARVAREQGLDAMPFEHGLKQAMAGTRDDTAPWFTAVAELDLALVHGRDGQAQLEKLKEANPQALVRLLDGVALADQARRVVRFWPY